MVAKVNKVCRVVPRRIVLHGIVLFLISKRENKEAVMVWYSSTEVRVGPSVGITSVSAGFDVW